MTVEDESDINRIMNDIHKQLAHFQHSRLQVKIMEAIHTRRKLNLSQILLVRCNSCQGQGCTLGGKHYFNPCEDCEGAGYHVEVKDDEEKTT